MIERSSGPLITGEVLDPVADPASAYILLVELDVVLAVLAELDAQFTQFLFGELFPQGRTLHLASFEAQVLRKLDVVGGDDKDTFAAGRVRSEEARSTFFQGTSEVNFQRIQSRLF